MRSLERTGMRLVNECLFFFSHTDVIACEILKKKQIFSLQIEDLAFSKPYETAQSITRGRKRIINLLI